MTLFKRSILIIIFLLFLVMPDITKAAEPLKVIINQIRVNSPALNETYKDFMLDEINEAFFYEGISIITPKEDEKKVSFFQLLNKYSARYFIDGSITKIGDNFSVDFKVLNGSEKKTIYFFKEGSGSKAYKENVEKLVTEISSYIFKNEGINASTLKKKEKPKHIPKAEPQKEITPEAKEVKEVKEVPALKSAMLEQKEEKQEKEKTINEETKTTLDGSVKKEKTEEKVAPIPQKEISASEEKIEDKTVEKPNKIVEKREKVDKDKPAEEIKKKVAPLIIAKEKESLPDVDTSILSDKTYEKTALVIFPFLTSGDESETIQSKIREIIPENINNYKPTRFISAEDASEYSLEKLFLSLKKIFKRNAADYVGYGSVVSFAGEIIFNFCIVDKEGNYLFKKTEKLELKNIDESLKHISYVVVETLKEKDGASTPSKIAKVTKDDIKREEPIIEELEKIPDTEKKTEVTAKTFSETVKPKTKVKTAKVIKDKVKENKEIADIKREEPIAAELEKIPDTEKKAEVAAKTFSETVKPKTKVKTKEKKKETAKPGKFSMKKSSKPLSVKSDTLEAFNQSKTIIFFGNVVAQKDDMTMYSDKLTVYYEENSKEVKEIIADASEGKRVRVVQIGRTATGKRAHFYRKENKIVMTGDPVVTQEENSVTGDKITYFLDDEKSLVESGKEKRVNAIIYPKKAGSGE